MDTIGVQIIVNFCHRHLQRFEIAVTWIIRLENNMRQHYRQGFTLVELLVILGILSILMAMLFPAIMKVREYSNRADCTNHLRIIGQGFNLYLAAHQSYFPTGGAWGVAPEDSINKSFVRVLNSAEQPFAAGGQNWGWMYQLLPYVGYEGLWNLRRGPALHVPWATTKTLFYDPVADNEIRQTAVEIYSCPTRRNLRLINNLPFNIPHFTCDYAGNAGPFSFVHIDGAWDEHAQWADTTEMPASYTKKQFGMMVMGPVNQTGPDSIQNSLLHIRDVTDGLSHTLLVGEKAYNTDRYNVHQFGEQCSFCYGFSPSTLRTGGHAPVRDFTASDPFVASYPFVYTSPPPINTANVIQDFFGSAHPYSFNALFADGSVRPIRYEIPSDPQILPNLYTDGLKDFGIQPLPSPPNPPNSLSLTLFQRLCHRSDGGRVNLIDE